MPKHVAIVMDGNGRWAQQRHRPRAFGHRAGVKTVRLVVEAAISRGIEALTLFAFSSENWARPASEVSLLMDLFLRAMRKETAKLSANGVRITFIGDRRRFSGELQAAMNECERDTEENLRLRLNIAVNYGGRLEIVHATRRIAERVSSGDLALEAVNEQLVDQEMMLSGGPALDLFIRTGGECRISNFLLWQLAYSELYFTPILWPEFSVETLDAAIADYAKRERRYGQTSAQLQVNG